jgi:Protein of unknown function (DUF3365)
LYFGVKAREAEAMETKLKLNLIFFGLEFNITRVLSELRVLLKVNFFLLPAMIATYAATGYLVWNQLSANAEQEITETARLMLGGARAMRTYTTTQVETEAFNYFRVQFPDFAYKEAALNPTDLRDRTADWESDIVNFFCDNPSKAEFAGHRNTPTGSSLYLSTPIRADSDSCLGCHGRAENAPPELVKLYGSGNGFGWRLNDVIGAQIVRVPAEVAHSRAAAAMKTVSIWLGGIFAGLYAIVNVIAFAFISRLVGKPAAP